MVACGQKPKEDERPSFRLSGGKYPATKEPRILCSCSEEMGGEQSGRVRETVDTQL